MLSTNHNNMATYERKLEIDTKLKNSTEKLKNLEDAQIEYSKIGMKDSQEFFYRISLLSDCNKSKFVSYIQNSNGSLNYLQILFISWVLLLVALISGIYRNHFHNYFLHYQLQRRVLEGQANQESVAQEALKETPETIFNAYEGIDNLIKVSNQRLGVYKKSAINNSKNESFYEKLWVLSMNSAHFGFSIGMTLLVIFAMLNIE
jgi:hypothetical protein